MKKIAMLFSLAFAFGCKPNQPLGTTMETKVEKTAEGDLIGQQPVKELLNAPYRDWFVRGYESYRPNAQSALKLRGLTNHISIAIFMGTWCEDSQDQVPKFYKVLHEIGFDEKNVKLIFVDRNKTTPQKLENGLNIANVPTFIFYKTTRSGGKKGPGGEEKIKELNRIVESPRETLEQDILKILSGQAYKHIYEN